MPELPEVETTRRGIEPHLVGERISGVVIRQASLRWQIPAILKTCLKGQTILSVQRRGKYLLVNCGNGHLLLHLGMSGSLRVVLQSVSAGKHDHFDLLLDNGQCLRLRDPRRFGAVLWTTEEPLQHSLLRDLGPEPLADEFTADYLADRAKGRKLAVKLFIMDSKVVVGVGNIYANEALFRAGIHPACEAGSLSRSRWQRLVEAIRQVLEEAILAGGTSMRDFTNAEGSPGYFALQLQVYGKPGQECPQCGRAIQSLRLGQRSTYFCSRCQR